MWPAVVPARHSRLPRPQPVALVKEVRSITSNTARSISSSSKVVSNQAIGAGGGQGHGGGLYLARISMSTLTNDMVVGNRATTSNNRYR